MDDGISENDNVELSWRLHKEENQDETNLADEMNPEGDSKRRTERSVTDFQSGAIWSVLEQ